MSTAARFATPPSDECSLSRKFLTLLALIRRGDSWVVKHQSNSHSFPVRICGQVCKVPYCWVYSTFALRQDRSLSTDFLKGQSIPL